MFLTREQRKALIASASPRACAFPSRTRAHGLLDSRGDAQNANPLIQQARALDGGKPEIQTLAAQIDSEIEHPTSEGIVRGLKDTLYVPLNMGGLLVASHIRLPVTPPSAAAPSVNIPILFETNSTVVDEETRPNIMQLSQALQNPEFKGRHFLFVGYADIRGTEAHNLELSRERAQTIYQTLLRLDPTLEGRAEVTGRGSADPIDPRNTEDAYRHNRRLQVLLQ